MQGWANQTISVTTVIVTLAITSLLALYIFYAYRTTTRKTFYSKSFNISLACVAVITAAIIITIQSSIVVSLGMVGALSIVRFRTAIKNPMDLMFLFWSISTGIICGAGFSIFAVVLAVVLSLFIVLLNILPQARVPKLLILNCSSNDASLHDNVMAVIKKYSKHSSVKACNMTSSSMDMTVEISTKSDDKQMLFELTSINEVTHASIMLHDGEVTF